jgi:ABC-type nickel/cobalt efflux system permease component RcnA
MNRLSAILSGETLPLKLILIGMAAAFALGALHAFSPGHGKTVVAAYLVGNRGTGRHAAFLGSVVTLTHTAGVFLLGIVTLFLSRYVVPEKLYPWIGFVSGLTILYIGLTLFRQRLSGLDHDHGPDGHSHDVPQSITFRSLLALGFSGGIIPCPSALVVLLSAIALHRIAVGLLFIAAFSVGLASVLVGVGILVVRTSRLLSRFDSQNWAARVLPVVSAAIISVIGLGISIEAIGGANLLRGPLSFGGGPLAILALGLFLGLKHATDADHVVAVTTFVSHERSLLRSCWIGAFWGLGHTVSLGVAGLFVIGLKVNIPEWLSARLELCVAGMLVVLGLRVLYRAARHKGELPVKRPLDTGNENAEPVQWHGHWLGSHSHAGWKHVGIRPMLVGLVHGAAGSAALMLLVLSTIRSPLQGFLYIVIFGFGSILGMLLISFLLALPLHWARGKTAAMHPPIQLMAGAFSCVFGLYLGIEIWKSLP